MYHNTFCIQTASLFSDLNFTATSVVYNCNDHLCLCISIVKTLAFKDHLHLKIYCEVKK